MCATQAAAAALLMHFFAPCPPAREQLCPPLLLQPRLTQALSYGRKRRAAFERVRARVCFAPACLIDPPQRPVLLRTSQLRLPLRASGNYTALKNGPSTSLRIFMHETYYSRSRTSHY